MVRGNNENSKLKTFICKTTYDKQDPVGSSQDFRRLGNEQENKVL